MLSWWTLTLPSTAHGACDWPHSACSWSANTGAVLLPSWLQNWGARMTFRAYSDLQAAFSKSQATIRHTRWYVYACLVTQQVWCCKRRWGRLSCHAYAQSLMQQCVSPSRSTELCAKAAQIRIRSGSSLFFTTRVFPTHALGTEDGWQYYYPVHEVREVDYCFSYHCADMPSM